MYKVVKSAGHYANVIVMNTDNMANINLGRLSREILNKLTEKGIDYPDTYEAWSMEVNKDVANELSKMAMRMTKPIRDQRKPENKKKANKEIDAMDVLLGLANYN